MDSKFWLERWQTADTPWDRSDAHPLLVKYFSPMPARRVLVPLCGKSIDLLWLAKNGHSVVGAELSSLACEAFFKENQLELTRTKSGKFEVFRSTQLPIEIWCGDFFELPSEVTRDVSAIYDRAALVALPPELRTSYADKLVEVAKDSGFRDFEILLISVEKPPGDLSGPPFSVREPELINLFQSLFTVKFLGLGENDITRFAYRLTITQR